MPEDDLAAPLRELLADRYAIERELGRGGMAVVYLAHDRKLDRPVAIKVLHGELASAIGADRFLREIEITARLSHPRIIPVHDSGSADGMLYYVMPFVRGESLRDRITREGQLPVDDAVTIALSAASALTHAHELGVVHRDIKPENILLASGEALVADFGIGKAGALAHGPRITQTGVAIGTPAYMSPEQSAGDPGLDGRSDLFSLGCVLYEMLVGESPFRAPTMQAIIARAALEPMPSIRSVRPGVSSAVENVVRTALEKVPADRFPTASAFSAALSRAAAASTPAAPARAMSPTPKRRRPSVVILAAGVLVALAAAGATLFAKRTPPRGGIAVLGFDNHGSNPDDDYIGAGLADEITSMLVKLPNAKVLALRSQTRGAAVPDSVGRATGAKTLLRGDFQHIGSGVRVTVSMIDAEDGSTVSTERYSQDSLDVFALRDTVAQAVVQTLRLALGNATPANWRTRSTSKPEALEAYAQGRLLFRTRRGRQDLERATQDFRRAIELDSSYAQAWSGLADAYSVQSAFGIYPAPDSFPRAKEFAMRALRLDSTLAEAQAGLSLINTIFEEDVAGGLARSERALQLNPYYADAHLFHAWALLYDDRVADALEAATRAKELDPFSVLVNTRLAWFQMIAGRSDDAERTLRFVLELDPANDLAWTELGYVYMARPGACDKAIDAADHIGESFTMPEGSIKGYVYAKCGQAERARALIATLEQESSQQFVFASRIAMPFAGLGQMDSAFAWLGKAIDQRVPISPSRRFVEPFAQPFKTDPRFEPLLARRARNARQ